MTKANSVHLVAPELRAGLELFPDFDFSQGMAPFRQPFDPALRPPLPPELADLAPVERFIAGRDGNPDVRVLHYAPPAPSQRPRPAVLHMHGGGYVLGSPELNDASNRALVLTHDCVVVSVDYRLAPETAWPGALNDNYAALCWLAENAAELGVDPARIAIAGESAGGGHAAALALHARNRGGPAICFQMLDAPMLDDRTGTGADPHPHTGHFVWTPEKNRFGWGALLGHEPGVDGVDETAAPARAADLAGMPPTFILVGSLDLFLEEDMEFTRRLTRAGVPAELHVIAGAYHGFGIAQQAPQCVQAAGLRREALARAFAA